MIRKILASLLFTCPALFAGELTTFKAITEDLAVGKEIIVVVRDAFCKMEDPNERKIPISTMVFKPATLLFTDSLFSFDAVKFAGNTYPAFPNGVLQRGSFRMDNNGNVNMVVAFFDAETNKKNDAWKDVKINCQLGNGVKVFQR